jgi:surfactin synthase thioesterase subunit
VLQIAPGFDRQAIQLFCVPHAGAGPSAFRGWRERLLPKIETVVIQLPGRESRFREAPYSNIASVVADLAEAVLPFLETPRRFAFFGNSLGGLIAFETLQEIRRRGAQAAHLFVSAVGAPHLIPPLPPMGHLADRELIREVSDRYDGIPAPIMQDEEFLAAMLPALRADIRMLEEYERIAPRPLHCPITAFGGLRDRIVPAEHIARWGEQTTGAFTCNFLEEGHLYLQSARRELTSSIRDKLLESVDTPETL